MYASFREFYPFYLSEHSDRMCRRMHFIGSTLVLLALAWLIVSGRWMFWWLLPLFGYGCAWIGHFLFEKNKPATFKAYPRRGYFVDSNDVLAARGHRDTIVVNALNEQLHKGLEPSRYGRPGHIPGSCNVSAAAMVDPATKAFVPLADAETRFAAQGFSRDKRVIAYCGGGISATIDLFMLHRLGYDKLTLYDGSMGEWAKDTSLPIETD